MDKLYYVKDGKVRELTPEEATDPFRPTRTLYADRVQAERAAELGEMEAAHLRSREKLGLDEAQYRHFNLTGELP